MTYAAITGNQRFCNKRSSLFFDRTIRYVTWCDVVVCVLCALRAVRAVRAVCDVRAVCCA
jgi:nucleoside diphosphate kinase